MVDILLIDVAPFEHSTRPRKIARSLAAHYEVAFVGLSRVGRLGMVGSPGRWMTADGIRVRQVWVAPLQSSRAIWATLANLVVYFGAFVSLTLASLRSPARIIIVSNPALLLLGVLLTLTPSRHLVFDARERPSAIRMRGSLSAWIARIDRLIFSVARSRVAAVLTVCEDHAAAYRKLGFRDVEVVFNALPQRTTAPSPPPPSPPTVVGYIGSLYPNRGLEQLIGATGRLNRNGESIQLRIVGPVSADYWAKLSRLIEDEGVGSIVKYVGRVEHDQVRREYERVHVAAALYGDDDPANDSMPNKLFDAFDAGRPVIANQPQAQDLLAQFDCGFPVSLNHDELAQQIEDLVADRQLLRDAGARGFTATQQTLNWEHQIGPFLQRVDRWIGGAR